MGIIQAYEVCYEALLKSLKRYLNEKIGIPHDAIGGAKPMFRLANENNLLSSPLENAWFNYVEYRNASSHDYGIDKLQSILEHIPHFIDDAIDLYQTMSEQTWQ